MGFCYSHTCDAVSGSLACVACRKGLPDDRLTAAQLDNVRNVTGFTNEELARAYGISVEFVRIARGELCDSLGDLCGGGASHSDACDATTAAVCRVIRKTVR